MELGTAVGIASFGIQICQGLLSYYDAWKGYDSDVSSAYESITDLSKTLSLLKSSLRRGNVDNERAERVQTCLQSCVDALRKLEAERHSLQKHSTPEGAREKVRSALQRSWYPFKKENLGNMKESVAEIQERLKLALQVLHLDSITTSQDLLIQLSAQQQIEEYKRIVAWLCPADPWTNHDSARQRHEKFTGDWLLQSDNYRKWKLGKGGRVWMCGKAGCGKTVLCSTAIEDIRDHCQQSADKACAFFYFSFSDKHKQSDQDLLRSLVAQLGRHEPGLSMLRRAYERYDRSVPGPHELQAILLASIESWNKVFLFLDALDECPEEHDVRLGVLDRIEKLTSHASNLNVFGTSRELPQIRESMDALGFESLRVATCAVDADISIYVANQLSGDRGFARFKPATLHLIEATVAKRADGMFRWAYCQLQALKRLKSTAINFVAQVLDTLPTTLDETYTRMLLDIEDMYHNHAITLLQWLAYARSPPTLAELVEVAITDPIRNDSCIDVHNRGSLEDTLNILSGLVTIEGGGDAKAEKHWKKGSFVCNTSTADYDQGNAIRQARTLKSNTKVRLAHFSVMEFLESQRILEGKARRYHLDSARGHDFVMRSCLTYISHYSTSHERTSSELDLGEFPLLMYAVKSWYYHSAMRKGNDAAFETTFLQNPTARNAWLSVHCPDQPSRDPFRDIRLLGSDLYYASLLGLPPVVDGLLKSVKDVNTEGGRYGNALQAASYGGHLRVMRQLLDKGADANALGGQYGNALQAASYAGHIETARLLLNEGADVNVQNGHFGSALQAATYNRHVEMMHLLLEHDAHLCAFALIEILTKRQLDMVTHLVPYLKPESMAHEDQVHSKTLLHWAAEVGSKAVASQSLLLGANVHAQDRYGETALHYAAGEGHLEIVKSLVLAGSTLDALNARAQTPLFCAQNHGPRLGSRSHQRVAQYLMSRLARKGKSINRHNANVFIDASSEGRITILQQLLDQGADPNTQGGQFGNALQAASRGGHIETAQLLLDKGADVNAKGGHFGNALQAAIYRGHIKTARLLLDKGADVNVQGGYHGNALQAAARGGHIEATGLLLDKGADVSVPGGLYGYALHAASEGGHLEISQLLLNKGADINAQGGQFGNALQAASIGGHIETAQLLLDKDADVNAQGGLYGNALQGAICAGYIETAQLLLDKGADVNAQGGHFSNALQAAVCGGHIKTAQLLLDKGADVNVQGGYHGNTLQAAARGGHIEATGLLLDKGADISVPGGLYGYALHAASEGGHLEISQLLLNKGADINAQGGKFGNALQAASRGGHIETARLLLDKGADVNAKGGHFGNTLQAAVCGGHIKTARLLLDKGVDVNAQGGLYGDAFQAASAEGYAEVLQLLQVAGARDPPVGELS